MTLVLIQREAENSIRMTRYTGRTRAEIVTFDLTVVANWNEVRATIEDFRVNGLPEPEAA